MIFQKHKEGKICINNTLQCIAPQSPSNPRSGPLPFTEADPTPAESAMAAGLPPPQKEEEQDEEDDEDEEYNEDDEE